MPKITELLKNKKFTISVEIVPPRNGTGTKEILSNIENLRNKIDFISITKGAGGSLRGGTLPISYLAYEKFGILPVSHFVCRERTKAEIENDILDLYYFNVNNILALRGDPPAGSKDEDWDGDYKYAYQLVEQINNLNKGRYIQRKNIDKGDHREGIKTDFCILVAGHPEDQIEKEVEHMNLKVSAGAEIIITQMIFSFEEYKGYVESLRKAGIKLPVIPGIRPLVSINQAESVENFFGLKVNAKLKNILTSAKSPQESRKNGLKYTAEMIKKLKEYGAPGVHLFILDDFRLVDDLLNLI